MEFARACFELDSPNEDGTTPRQHLEQFERQTGKTDTLLETAREEPALYHVWEWFTEIYMGDVPTWQELKAWQDATGEQPTSAEFRLIRRLALKRNEVEHGRNNSRRKG